MNNDDLDTLYESIVCARVATLTRGDASDGARAWATELIDELERYAAEVATPSALAYALAMRIAYDRFGARRTFSAMAPRVWTLLVARARLPARDEWRRVWRATLHTLETHHSSPQRAPAPSVAQKPTASPPEPPTDEDTPWWTGWGAPEVERWLAEVREAHCDVVWCPEFGRPRVAPHYAYTPPWVLSDAYQLRALLTEYFTNITSRRAA